LDFALILDADSLMDPRTILRLVRIMQANPRLGILQSLLTGLPTESAFARAVQFGMRLGTRSYALGSAWWQGDCGSYWGHNALIRIAPFREHCGLPRLPGGPPLGGWVLSHDQVEAILMRRAGYAVRVLPVEGGSWEESPPTLLEFIRRDRRWCQGNMQYLKLLGLPGLRPVNRVQLALAILIFIASPAWVLLMGLAALRLGLSADPAELVNADLGLTLLCSILTMVFAPLLATLADLLLTPSACRAFGGQGRLLASVGAEILFVALLAPVMAIAHTRFLIELFSGRPLGWEPQRRASHRVCFAEALGQLWPQTFVGLCAFMWLGSAEGGAAVWISPFFLGALLAVPLAMVSASPTLNTQLTRLGLWRVPEETAPDPLLSSLDLPALGLLAGNRSATDTPFGGPATAVEAAE
jgi:membrane glycosyltransferase